MHISNSLNGEFFVTVHLYMKPGINAIHTIEQVRSLVHLVSVLDDCDTKSTFTMEDTAKCGLR